MRQRAWPDTIITAQGMRHFLENVPPRAELRLLAYEAAGEVVGWATVAPVLVGRRPGARPADPRRRPRASRSRDRLGADGRRGGAHRRARAHHHPNRLARRACRPRARDRPGLSRGRLRERVGRRPRRSSRCRSPTACASSRSPSWTTRSPSGRSTWRCRRTSRTRRSSRFRSRSGRASTGARRSSTTTPAWPRSSTAGSPRSR